MTERIPVPIFSDMAPDGFFYGGYYVVEFDPDSLWYETSLTIAASALKQGIKVEYHVFQHFPNEAVEALSRLGVDATRFEKEGRLTVIDSYTQTMEYEEGKIAGGRPYRIAKTRDKPLDLVKSAENWAKEAKAGYTDRDKRWLHIDDNTGIFLQYNDEKTLIDKWRTAILPYSVRARETPHFLAFAKGAASDEFYSQFEASCDGILDLTAREEGGRVENYIRVRMLRGKTFDSSWHHLQLTNTGEVRLADMPSQAVGPGVGPIMPVRFLEEHDEINLARFAVVGNYLRYGESTRNTLKDLRQKIMAAFESSRPKQENFLVWAPPGSGKTSFVRKVSSALGHAVRFVEINLADSDQVEFRKTIGDIGRFEGPLMCFIDEVDSMESEAWPFEALLATLDEKKPGARRVYVLAGSGGGSLTNMKERMSVRPKGQDVLSRIPAGNEYTLPGMSEVDNILVFLSSLVEASARLGKQVDEVEKLGLYYVATSADLGNARKLREFAERCAERVPRGDARLKYDNMFEAGDPANKEFWVGQTPRVPNLVNSFLKIENLGALEQAEEVRRLAAIMFTDMVGFTATTQRNEAAALALLDEQRRIVRPLFGKYNGREVKTIGDAFLVEFASSQEAVNCAIEIQSGFKRLNSNRPEERKILIRVGIHLGDVIHRGADVAGDAVNVASRIEPLAPPGGVCVSGQVYQSVVNKVQAGFESMGTPELKNVATPVTIYRVLGLEERAAQPSSKARLPPDRIAVLPFSNISADVADEYFADGMTEELISSVSRTKGLRVIARTSVMRYKGAGRPIGEIARELNVGSVLEGSVRKAGDKVRVTVQLVDASNEEPRWSQEYDRELRDVFEIQGDIAQKVAEALRLHVLGAPSSVERSHTQNTGAYIDYLRGRQAWNKRNEEGLKQAIVFFEKALAADADYAMAYTGLADSYATLALLELVAPNEAYPKAKEAIGKALALNPRLAEAHTSLGLVRFQYDWNWAGAEEEFHEAIRLNPNYAPAHHYFADYLKAMGRFEEALSEIAKAQELDPLNLAINAGVGHVLYLSRQYDKAIEQYQETVDLDPAFMLTHVWFGRPYLEKGMFTEAISELETGVRLSGEGTLALGMLGHGLASAGKKEEAEQVLQKLKERSKDRYVPSYWVAVVYNGFKDRGRVLAWLKKAFDERSSWLVWSNVEPRFDWLRNDLEFASLMKAMKFP